MVAYHLQALNEDGNLEKRLTSGFMFINDLRKFIPEIRDERIAIVQQDCDSAPNWTILEVIEPNYFPRLYLDQPVLPDPLGRKFSLD